MVAQTGDFFRTLGAPDLAGDGTAVFFANRSPSTSTVRGVYAVSPAGTVQAVATNGGGFGSFGASPAVNAGGAVVFQATQPGTGGGDAGLYLGSTAGTTPTRVLTNNTSPLNNFGDSPAVSSTGRVAFTATQDGSSFSGVYAVNSDGTGLTAVATTNSGAFGIFENVDVNARGTVAFRGFLNSAPGFGIFVGDDPVADRVIARRDQLFGSTVDSVLFYRGLNDTDQLAFYFSLADGRTGIARVDLVPVPEPAAGLLALAAAPVVAVLRRRRPTLADG